MKKINIDEFNWNKSDGLIPAIIQDASTGQLLMLAYMNRDALQESLRTQIVTFYSRSKERLWVKGETSGNRLELLEILPDCDQDALLVMVKPTGPVCHKGTVSCFQGGFEPEYGFLSELEKIIEQRKCARPEGSYVVSLADGGINRMAQKVGEEGVEVALAAVGNNETALCSEMADLLFHMLVLLSAKKLSLRNIIEVLQERHRF